MESQTMGKVLVQAKIENLIDLYAVTFGQRTPEQVRTVDVSDAMVDTAATTLSLPTHLIQTLGLRPYSKRRVRTSAGVVERDMYEAVQLTIQGRQCKSDVLEVSDDCPVLIGQVPLELLDFVVDPIGQRLIGNPEHGGEHMLEVF